jgi:hypothetical protein
LKVLHAREQASKQRQKAKKKSEEAAAASREAFSGSTGAATIADLGPANQKLDKLASEVAAQTAQFESVRNDVLDVKNQMDAIKAAIDSLIPPSLPSGGAAESESTGALNI